MTDLKLLIVTLRLGDIVYLVKYLLENGTHRFYMNRCSYNFNLMPSKKKKKSS